MQRRQFVRATFATGSASALAMLAGCVATQVSIPARAQIAVIGGGYGATAAKYVRLLSSYKIDVIMVKPNTSRRIPSGRGHHQAL